MKKEKMVKDLKSSPIYNMSQSSLENFHTSFLCWLGNTYSVAFKKLFNKFNKKRFDEDKKHSCETQVKHTLLKNEDDEKNKSIRTDLEFKFNDNELIIIENKIKSFPNDEQLKIYSNVKEFDKGTTTFILLSLVKKKKMNLPNPWEYMSYLELANQMGKIFNKKFKYDKYYENYHKCLIQDYIFVIREISKIFETLISEIEEKKYDFYKYDKQEYENDEINKYDLRDIFVKFKTSELANYINKNINKKYNWEIKEGFSRKQGIVDIIRKIDEKFRFQIQLQGSNYSYGFVYLEKESNKWKKRIEIAKDLFEKKYWFVNTENPKKAKKDKCFLSFEPDFIYRCSNEKIDNQTYKKIMSRINTDIKEFEKNLLEIQNCISKFVK